MKITYKRSGVDVRAAEEFVRSLKGFVSVSKSGATSAFGSLFDLNRVIKKYREPVLVSSTDGVGTKLKLAQELNIHNTVGIDLVAMNVNDIVCLGARPLFFLDYIACGKVRPGLLKKVVAGIKKGLDDSGCLLLGGETAEMPGMYEKDEYDLAGFCVGIADRTEIVNGSKIKPSDAIIGLASSGLHSNGFSLVRKVFSKKERKKYARELLKPTRIYVRPILSLLYPKPHTPNPIKGIAHNTGGAFYTKVTKILPRGLGFRIVKGSWRPPRMFGIIKARAGLGDKEMYSTFNMGIGMIVVVNKKYAENTIKLLDRRGVKSYIIGEVIRSKREKIILT